MIVGYLAWQNVSLFFTNYVLFFFNDTATTEIYTLSLHDALPIYTIAKALINYENSTTSNFTISGTYSSKSGYYY